MPRMVAPCGLLGWLKGGFSANPIENVGVGSGLRPNPNAGGTGLYVI